MSTPPAWLDESLPGIKRLVSRFLRDPEDARDTVQDVLLRLHVALPAFRGDAAFKTFAYAIARNECLNKLRWRRARQWNHHVDFDSCAEWLGASPRMRDVLAEGRARRALQSLATADRRILVRYVMEERTVAELARVLGCAEGAAKYRVHRALARLRVAFESGAEPRGRLAVANVADPVSAIPVVEAGPVEAGPIPVIRYRRLLASGYLSIKDKAKRWPAVSIQRPAPGHPASTPPSLLS